MDRRGTGHRILGEVFLVDRDTLEAMDILEGVKSGAYYKAAVKVKLFSEGSVCKEPKEMSCIAYLYPAKDELLELEYFANYTAKEHGRYTPGPVNKEIIDLCRIEGRTLPTPAHSFATRQPSAMRTHCLRLLPGDDILHCLQIFVQSHEIDAAVILTVVGSTGLTTLRPAGVPKPKAFDGKHEIVSLTGTLSRHGHHLHMSISDADCGLVGGHVMEGCIVRTTAEIAIGILHGVEFTRPIDHRTGYDELSIKQSPQSASNEEQAAKRRRQEE